MAGPSPACRTRPPTPWTFRPSALHRDPPLSRSPPSPSIVRIANARAQAGRQDGPRLPQWGIPRCQRASRHSARLRSTEGRRRVYRCPLPTCPQRGRTAGRCGGRDSLPSALTTPDRSGSPSRSAGPSRHFATPRLLFICDGKRSPNGRQVKSRSATLEPSTLSPASPCGLSLGLAGERRKR
jgi:hypothetical protein